MAKERHRTSSLAVPFLIFTTNFFCQSIALDRGAENGSKLFLDARSQCLSQCGRPTENAETHSWILNLSFLKDVRKLRSACYQNCIKTIKESNHQSIRRRKRSTLVMENDGIYECPSSGESVKRKFGDIQNLSVTFLQQRSNYGNVTWIANVTWNALLSNENLHLADKWTGFIIMWLEKSLDNNIVSTTKSDCRFSFKNSTNLIIESGSSFWVYPSAIQVGVAMYPMTDNEYTYGVDVYTFYPNKTFTDPTTRSITNITNIPQIGSSLPRILAIVFGCVSGIGIVVIVLYWIWQRRSKRATLPQDQENFEYDASILYSTLDEKWVTEELIPLLETQNNFKCFIHFRDFEVGRILHENMADAVWKCRKNLAVVSEHFLKSAYCQEELDMALERVQRCRDYSLIVVNLDGVPIERLPKSLRIRTFLNLTNPQAQRTWRTRLVKQISVEEDKSCLKNEAKTAQPKSVLRVTSEGCKVISDINPDVSTSSSESIV